MLEPQVMPETRATLATPETTVLRATQAQAAMVVVVVVVEPATE